MAYKLSYAKRARLDILSIGRYTENEWGTKQRNLYLAKIFAAFEKIRTAPLSGKKREDIKAEIRSVTVEKHVIYYLVIKKEVRIAGILHERMDPALHL